MSPRLGSRVAPDKQPTFLDSYSGPFADAAGRVEVDRDDAADEWRARCHKCGHPCSNCTTRWVSIGEPRPWSRETDALAFTLERVFEVHHDIIAAKISAVVEAVTA